MSRLSLAQFIATASPLTDSLWAEMERDDLHLIDGAPVPRPCHVQYADNYVIAHHAGKFWVHAWWYAPIGYLSISAALNSLYDWYLEWNS